MKAGSSNKSFEPTKKDIQNMKGALERADFIRALNPELTQAEAMLLETIIQDVGGKPENILKQLEIILSEEDLRTAQNKNFLDAANGLYRRYQKN